jgi:hypothetical protein
MKALDVQIVRLHNQCRTTPFSIHFKNSKLSFIHVFLIINILRNIRRDVRYRFLLPYTSAISHRAHDVVSTLKFGRKKLRRRQPKRDLTILGRQRLPIQ